MNRALPALLVVVAVLGWAGATLASDPPVGLLTGGIAIVASGSLAALWIWPRIAGRPRPVRAAPFDALGALRDAGSAGTLGRERVVFTIQSLEFESGLRSGPSWSPDELRALLGLPEPEFRSWLRSHLDHLEQET